MPTNLSYYDYNKVCEKYLPLRGEGETKATQIVAAVNGLMYGWYTGGDVFDNGNYFTGCGEDLSDYANWLAKYTPTKEILDKIYDCYSNESYEELLGALVIMLFDEKYLEEQHKICKVGCIYACSGPFKYVDYDYEED